MCTLYTSSVLISLYCTSFMSGAVICGLVFLWSSSAYSGPQPAAVCGTPVGKSELMLKRDVGWIETELHVCGH